MTAPKPTVAAIMSGKGGEGKTTIAIAMCIFLSKMGFRSLLIDLDLGTNGAAYFFYRHFGRGGTQSNDDEKPTNDGSAKGIWELLVEASSLPDLTKKSSELPRLVGDNFYFAPSRTAFHKKETIYENISFEVNSETLRTGILTPLIERWSVDNAIDYVLIDTQAGYTRPTGAAAVSTIADRAFIVLEPSEVAKEAAENLLNHLERKPGRTIRVVTKLDARYADKLMGLPGILPLYDALPPLPWDIEVSHRMGSRKYPIDFDDATPFLFALFNTMRDAFPEISDTFVSFYTANLERLYKDYIAEVATQMEMREQREEEFAQLRFADVESRYQTQKLRLRALSGLFLAVAVVTALVDVSAWLEAALRYSRFIPVVLALILSFVLAFIGELTRVTAAQKTDTTIEAARLSRLLQEMNEKIDEYRSYVITKNREFLVEESRAREESEAQLLELLFAD